MQHFILNVLIRLEEPVGSHIVRNVGMEVLWRSRSYIGDNPGPERAAFFLKVLQLVSGMARARLKPVALLVECYF